jgi:hypothetical protein
MSFVLHDFVGAAYKYMNAVHENHTHYKGHDPIRIVLSSSHEALEPEVWALLPENFKRAD